MPECQPLHCGACCVGKSISFLSHKVQHLYGKFSVLIHSFLKNLRRPQVRTTLLWGIYIPVFIFSLMKQGSVYIVILELYLHCVLTNASYTILKIDVRWLNDHICKLDVCICLLCILDIGFLDEISVLAFQFVWKKKMSCTYYLSFPYYISNYEIRLVRCQTSVKPEPYKNIFVLASV